MTTLARSRQMTDGSSRALEGVPDLPAVKTLRVASRNVDWPRPNWLVRCAFYLSFFAIPFHSLYLPGTGERLGVTRLVQMTLLA